MAHSSLSIRDFSDLAGAKSFLGSRVRISTRSSSSVDAMFTVIAVLSSRSRFDFASLVLPLPTLGIELHFGFPLAVLVLGMEFDFTFVDASL
jgi:hypothetical protein